MCCFFKNGRPSCLGRIWNSKGLEQIAERMGAVAGSQVDCRYSQVRNDCFLARFFQFFFQKKRKHSASAKTCVQIATTGIKAIAAGTSSLEHEELIFTCLTILDRLNKASLLKAAPLEVEKMWFNFSRKVCSAGHNARALVYIRHLLQLLSAGRISNQENSAPASDNYFPEDGDGDARVYLSACALVCLCTALAATTPMELLSHRSVWQQTVAWLAQVGEASKREQLRAELGRVAASALQGALKQSVSSVRQLSFVKERLWCLVPTLCSSKSSPATLVAALKDCFASFPSSSFEAETDALLVFSAKKMEETRKSMMAALEGQEVRLEAASMLRAYVHKLLEAITGFFYSFFCCEPY